MIYTLEKRVNATKKLRTKTANVIAKILAQHKNISEVEFREKLRKKLFNNRNIHKEGYYNPPPFGISALFGSENNFKRLSFGTLRAKKKWPTDQNFFTKNSVGTIYVSPVSDIGAIGDFGISIYNGKNKAIQKHFKNCVEILEKIAKFSKVGMELRELHKYYNDLLSKYGVKKTKIVLRKKNISVGDNLGHTFPWSYEQPTSIEEKIIWGNNFNKLKETICDKRIFINSKEKFKIPPTIAFTIEFRSELKNPPLPNTSFHIVVLFINGKKTILENFKEVFEVVGMDFMKKN